MRVCSLFSGIGGIDLGFQQAGFDIVCANEYDIDAIKTYCNNFPECNLIEGDIRNVEIDDIPMFDVLATGFPCQPFSIGGKQKGFKDARGNLFFEIARILDKRRPPIVFLENVANLLDHDKGKTFLVIYNVLAQFGYCVKYKIMDSYEFGDVPQKRKRIFIVAFLDYKVCDSFVFPEEIPCSKTINDVIDRSIKHDDIYYYSNNSFYFEELQRIVTDKKALYKIRDNGVSNHKYYICPTLTANMGTFPDRVPVILDNYGIRKITPLECLAFMGFPQEFNFKGISLNSAYKQCGNSVVVPVIKRIAEKIREAMIKNSLN